MPPLQEMLTEQPMRTSRKGKEREPGHRDAQGSGPQVTDLDEKLLALRRRTAGAAPRTRERPDRSQNSQTTLAPPPNVSIPSSSTVTRGDRSPRLAPHSVSKHSPTSPRRHASPQVHARHSAEADPAEEFSRKLQISSRSSPRPHASQPNKSAQKLYNPDTDRIPSRRLPEPEANSDTTGSSYVPTSRQQREERGGAPRQLFDYRKDDPVRFSVLARPQQSAAAPPTSRPAPPTSVKPSGDYISASSTSSNNASQTSSVFTLSSTTDGSSASSNLFDGKPNQAEDNNNSFGKQLKRLYRNITDLESKVKLEDSDDIDDGMSSRGVLLKGKEPVTADADKEKWKKQVSDHKELAETIQYLLELSLSPSVPASLRTIPTKYNMIGRLWTYAFHKILESLRRASFQSPVALEHLQDFIYYAYTFYTGLLEEPTLNMFKSSWLEALGDLARYRMAVTAMVNSGIGGQGNLTTQAVSEAAADSGSPSKPAEDAQSVSDSPAARIDDSPSPSVGIAAARSMEIEPEKERWRNIAREWYGAGLAEQPGTGKLHHHLGLLSREVESEELRGIYHFTKSMTTLHPFTTSRENVLPIWSPAAQARRSLPEAKVSELFVLLHGMLFTNIQLDDFTPTLARFIERLKIEGAEEREWSMMAIVNIASILEYGRPSGLLRKLGVVGPKEAGGAQAAAMRVMAKKAAAGVPGSVPVDQDDKMEVDGDDQVMRSPVLLLNGVDGSEYPPAFTYALQLTFTILSFVLRHPHRQASAFARPSLNPYLTITLTFLATIVKHSAALEVLERSIPWQDLAAFFATIPRRVMTNQGLLDRSRPLTGERWPMLTSGVAPPLPEDWCMRGMEWVGRKVFERGYWKSGEDRKAELEVLEQKEGVEVTDGRIESDDDDDETNGSSKKSSSMSELERRWTRVCRSAVSIANTVEGLTWVEGTREWKVEGKLAQKVERWSEEDRVQRLEEEKRRMGKRWIDDAMDVDEAGADVFEESDDDDENDTEEIKALKARRRYLESLLKSARNNAATSPSKPRSRASKGAFDRRPQLNIVPGYSVLVIDTNILLSSLSMVASLIESLKWTVIIPLPVVMELDGLSTNSAAQLAEAASSALSYITSHIRSHSLSLKVQTSKGNYLTSLNVRTEEVDFSGDSERSMDDLILKAAIWQDEHWVDRTSMLKAQPASPETLKTAEKVVFLTLDRNLRLKSRSRQLPAASEKDLALLLSTAK